MKLKKIAKINTGLVLNRKKAKSKENIAMKYKLITLKSISQIGIIDKNELDKFNSNEILSENYITKFNDVVIRLSEPNTAVFIDKELEGLLIPSQFCLIRVKSDKINPKFLSWYLNSNYVKKEIQKSLIGSAIAIIKTSFLNDLEIRNISLEKQNKIVEINDLKIKEEKLTKKLIEEKNKLYNGLIKKIIEEKE